MIFKSVWLPYIGKVNFSLGEKVEKIFETLYKNDELKTLVDVLETPHLGIIHDVLNIPFYTRHDYLLVQWFLSYLFLPFQEELQRRKISTRVIPVDRLVQMVEFFQFYFLVYNSGHLPYSFPVEEAIFALNKKLYFEELKKLIGTYFTSVDRNVVENTTELILDICSKSRKNIFYVNSLFIAHILQKRLSDYSSLGQEYIQKYIQEYIMLVLMQILNRISRNKENAMDIFLKGEIDWKRWTSVSRLFSYYRLLKRIRDLSIVLLDSQFAYSKFIFNPHYIASILNFVEDDENIAEMLKILNTQLYQHPSVLYWDNKVREQIYNTPLFKNKKFSSVEEIFLKEENKQEIYNQIELIKRDIRRQSLKIFPKPFAKYIRPSSPNLDIKDLFRKMIINEEQDIKKNPQNIFNKIKVLIQQHASLHERSYTFIAEWVLWVLSVLLSEKTKFAIELNLNTVCFFILSPNDVRRFVSLGRKLVDYKYCFKHAELTKLESLIDLIKERNVDIRGFFFYSLDIVNIFNNQKRDQLDYLFIFLCPNYDKIWLFLGEDKDLCSKEHLKNFFSLLEKDCNLKHYLLKEHLIDMFIEKVPYLGS